MYGCIGLSQSSTVTVHICATAVLVQGLLWVGRVMHEACRTSRKMASESLTESARSKSYIWRVTYVAPATWSVRI